MVKGLSKRERIKELITTGDHTPRDICDILGITPGARAQYFSQLRLSGQYPIINDQGYLELIDEDSWHKYQDERKKQAAERTLKARTTDQQFDFLQKRVTNTYNKLQKAKSQSENDPNNTLKKLRYDKRYAEYGIAMIDFNNFCDKHNIVIKSPVDKTDDE